MNTTRIQAQIAAINDVVVSSKPAYNGLFGGRLGVSFYLHFAGKALTDERLLSYGRTHLEYVFEDLNNGHEGLQGNSLSSGGAGLAYVVNHLARFGELDFNINEEFDELESFLFTSARGQIDRDEIDYLHGAGGVIYYFATREQTPTVSKYLNELVGRLLEKVVLTEQGCWFRNHLGQNTDYKELIDLSLAHGLSGLLLILSEALPHLTEKARCLHVIREGARLIVRNELPVNFEGNEFSGFPCSIKSNQASVRINRLAWCYGDLNQVLLLYTLGHKFRDERYSSVANRIGLQCVARRSEIATLCTDTHFCHGTSGLAQIYKSLYHASNNWIYKNAYHYWIEKTVQHLDQELIEHKYSENPVSLLEGFTGVAMVLVDYLTDQTSNGWSRLFLLS